MKNDIKEIANIKYTEYQKKLIDEEVKRLKQDIKQDIYILLYEKIEKNYIKNKSFSNILENKENIIDEVLKEINNIGELKKIDVLNDEKTEVKRVNKIIYKYSKIDDSYKLDLLNDAFFKQYKKVKLFYQELAKNKKQEQNNTNLHITFGWKLCFISKIINKIIK